MYYYDVETLVSLSNGSSVFTYSSEETIPGGSLVTIPFGRKQLSGIVIAEAKKPEFDVKSIKKIISTVKIPHKYLEFSHWFLSYYASKNDEVAAIFLPTFLQTIPAKPKQHLSAFVKPLKQTLTGKQAGVVKAIQSTSTPVILHGVVGSGKTRVYFELAEKALQDNKSVLLLSPEIPLSTQLAKRAREYFGSENVELYHSNLTQSERRSIWLGSLDDKRPKVYIGPRSALFLPYKNLGLVCVDEFHESSYKQQDQVRYHANDAAASLAKIHEARLVLGSATPALREYEIAKQKNYPIVDLQELALQDKQSKREYVVVDQRDRSNFTRDPYLSNDLIRAIEAALSNEQQILILHNKRGTARTILCENCAWTMDCPRCDGHLVYHQDSNICLCHICGHKSPLPVQCPVCGKTDILLRSLGTKAMVDSVRKLFPHANVARFDSDNLKADSLGSRMDEVESGEIDILVGTQLLAKGLDLKKLAVVGITSAEGALQLPDFSSAERLYQMIIQVAGRVARGHGDGLCVIQTYQPNHPLFSSILKEDWRSFYDAEIAERKSHLYPPFCFLGKLSCTRKTASGAEKAAEKLAQTLKANYPSLRILGPSSSFRERERGSYSQTIIMKSSNRKVLLEIAKNIPAGWQADIDPISLI